MYYIIQFAKNVKNAHIYKLEDAIIQNGDAKYMYNFSKELRLINEKLEDAIIETKNVYYIRLFLKKVRGENLLRPLEYRRDTLKLTKALMETIKMEEDNNKEFLLEDFKLCMEKDICNDYIEEIKDLFQDTPKKRVKRK